MTYDLVEIGVSTRLSPPITYTVVFSGNPSLVNGLSPAATESLSLSSDAADWVFEAAKKLDALGRLRQDWDSYGGLPLSPTAKRMTFDALSWLKTKDLPVPAVVLGSNGTVHLEWRSQGRELEVGFGEPGTVEYAKMDDQGQIEEGKEDIEVRDRLRVLTAWLIGN